MYPLIQKTFGGLSPQYYIRQLIFGILIAAFVHYMSTQGGNQSIQPGMMFYIIVSTFFYPYSRFVYESIVRYIMGENIFFINAILMLIVKFITMILCWAFSIFIAPVGLAYLYYQHSKAEAQ